MENRKPTEKIIGCAMKVHTVLGAGFLESVYQQSWAHELNKAELNIECERRLNVIYDGLVVGHFSADIGVECQIILELKAIQVLTSAHEVQLVN